MNIWKCADCGSLDLGQDAVINPNHLNKNGGSLIHEEDICWLDEVFCNNCEKAVKCEVEKNE